MAFAQDSWDTLAGISAVSALPVDPHSVTHAVVAEWLRRLTRNQFRSAGVGSNPTDRESFATKIYFVTVTRGFLNLEECLASMVQW